MRTTRNRNNRGPWLPARRNRGRKPCDLIVKGVKGDYFYSHPPLNPVVASAFDGTIALGSGLSRRIATKPTNGPLPVRRGVLPEKAERSGPSRLFWYRQIA